MSDARAIVQLYDHARAHDLPVVLATVISTYGSTYRKRGARMLLCADGRQVGVVSGGCLEADVKRRAWFLQRPGALERVRYDTGSGEDATYEFGLGCRGVVELIVERLDLKEEPEAIRLLRQSFERRLSATLEIDVASLQTPPGTAFLASSDAVYREVITPPIQLIVFGSGADVPPVRAISRVVGWSVVVVDSRLHEVKDETGDRLIPKPPGEWLDGVKVDERTACVIMTHRMKEDAAYLADVLRTNCGYIGCLGPASRTEALIDELAVAGVTLSEADRARLRSPIGLDLGAERPQEIALAIVAEIAAALAGANGGPLSERGGPIHLSSSSQALR